MTTDETLESLYRALAPWYEGRFRGSAAWEKFSRRFLQPGEKVLLALEGEGWNLVGPLLLVTDRRVLRLRDCFGWRLLREVPAAEVLGAEHADRLLGDVVSIRLRSGGRMRMRSKTVPGSQLPEKFVAGLNALVSGGGPPGRR